MGLSDLNLRVLIPYLPVLGWGALRTLEVSALAIALSFPLGLVGALMRLSDNRLARSIATVYVEVVRNIPLLVVLYILFLVLPLYGIPINALTAGVLGLAINSTAFTIEIIRAGFAAIPPGQYEAARSLGLHRLQMLRLVIVPQVFRIVLPTLGKGRASCEPSTVIVPSAWRTSIAVFPAALRNAKTREATEPPCPSSI